MAIRRRIDGTGLFCFPLLILLMRIQGCFSLTCEGMALLEFYAKIDSDPYGNLLNWNPSDSDPCLWSGVYCVGTNVEMLDLSSFSLQGELSPELGKLIHLRSLVLFDNHFGGSIPKEIGELKMLEVLDLRNNNLSGTIPKEIGRLQSLKRLLMCYNNIQGHIPPELGKLRSLTELQFDENLALDAPTGSDCINKRFGNRIAEDIGEEPKRTHLSLNTIGGKLRRYFTMLPLFVYGKEYPYNAHNRCNNEPGAAREDTVQSVHKLVNIVRRKLYEGPTNLPATPATGGLLPEEIALILFNRSSGSFPAVPNTARGQNGQNISSVVVDPSPQHSNITSQNGQHVSSGGSRTWVFIGVVLGVLILLVVGSAFVLCFFRYRAVNAMGPWKTGLSGQLQKALVTGVPKLNRSELETACEDFSNIVMTIWDCTIYKGTLSSGVEIAVLSVPATSSKQWSKRSDSAFRRKIHTLSRANHKNLINLLGYCEDNEPFTRMMVFEYATNGTLSEHLHVEGFEPLDWNMRVRIIMGIAYCLQYLHNLNPAVAYSDVAADSVLLTDDYAAKVMERSFWKVFTPNSEESESSKHSEHPPCADPETNVYSFGKIVLEVISGKLPNSAEHGSIVDWAAEYLNVDGGYSKMVDSTLKSFNVKELEVICKVAQDCIHSNARKRPSMREVVSRLREIITITPEAAVPRLSPLWWAELEILSSEA